MQTQASQANYHPKFKNTQLVFSPFHQKMIMVRIKKTPSTVTSKNQTKKYNKPKQQLSQAEIVKRQIEKPLPKRKSKTYFHFHKQIISLPPCIYKNYYSHRPFHANNVPA